MRRQQANGRPDPPVRACVGAELWRPNILVEIMVTAAK
jgi:enamine deaminase RidA (YjgF/YER057c/UK114 family)